MCIKQNTSSISRIRKNVKNVNKTNFKFLKTLRVSTYIFIYQNFIFRQFVPLKVPSPTPLFVQIIMDRFNRRYLSGYQFITVLKEPASSDSSSLSQLSWLSSLWQKLFVNNL